MTMVQEWEPVIGLEVHVQLATRSKLFSRSPTAFGALPNTQAGMVDIALPGTLPVPNFAAIHMAVLFGLAVEGRVANRSVFARKNYFYPDLPRGYQISQYEAPIVQGGYLVVPLPDGGTCEVRFVRAHLEEDAGKSLHEQFPGQTAVDLNRAGMPLLEIVSEPDMHNAEEAVACLRCLHSLVCNLGICDGNMAQGSLRCDVNVSLRPSGTATLGERTEIKNINSFRFVEKAILGEIDRQREILETGGCIVRETRLYDADRDETRPMRSKEMESDYRYFPDPDLLPLVLSEEEIENIRADLPELPAAKRERLAQEYSLDNKTAAFFAADRALADYFEETAKASGDAKRTANWIMVELAARLHQDDVSIGDSPVSARQLAELLRRVADGTISGKIAKAVFAAMWAGEGDADTIIAAQGLRQVTDSDALEVLVQGVVDAHPGQTAKYRAAPPEKQKRMLGFFVGQVMQRSKGRADPAQVNALLIEKLGS